MKLSESPLFVSISIAILISYLGFLTNIQHFFDLSYLYDKRRMINVGLLTITCIVLLVNKNFQSHWLSIWNDLPILTRRGLLAIVGLGVLSSFFAPFPSWAILELTQYILFFSLVLSVAVLVQSNTKFMQQILLLSCALFAFLFLFQTVYSFANTYLSTYPDFPRTDTIIGAFSFSQIRFFNQVQTITLPLLGAVVVFCKKINKTVFIIAFLMLFAWWLLVFISGARGTLLAVTTGMILMGFFLDRFKADWFKFQIVAIFSAVLIYIIFFYSGEETARAITREGSSGRLNWWGKTILGILEKPLIGYGPMQSSIEGLGLHGHNYFLTMTYEWGAIASIGFTLILVFSLYQFFLKVKQRDQVDSIDYNFKVCLLVALISAWLHSFLSDLFKTPIAQMWLVIIIGYAIGIYYEKDQDKSLVEKYNWKLSILLFCSLTLFIYNVYPSMSNHKERQKEYIEIYEPRILWPRFWQQGKIGWEDKEKNQEIINKYLIE